MKPQNSPDEPAPTGARDTKRAVALFDLGRSEERRCVITYLGKNGQRLYVLELTRPDGSPEVTEALSDAKRYPASKVDEVIADLSHWIFAKMEAVEVDEEGGAA